jgi:hypothetical protein
MNAMNDKNGKMISKGDTVNVDAPKNTDYHRNEFQGQVISLKPSEGTALVADQDGECFDVDFSSIEVV